MTAHPADTPASPPIRVVSSTHDERYRAGATATQSVTTAGDIEQLRRFVVWSLLGTCALLAAVVAINLWFDPLGVLGPPRFGGVQNARERAVKLDLLERLAAPPQVMVLGSSRAMKVNPADIEQRTGRSAFNAAVSGGTPQDAYLYTRWAADRYGDDFPHVVWAIDLESFRTKDVQTLLDPRLARYLPARERALNAAASYKQLLEWQTLQVSVRILRRVIDNVSHGRRAGARSGARGGSQRKVIDDRGFQVFEVTNGDRPARPRIIDLQMSVWINFIFRRDGYHGIEAEPRAYFERAIKVAHAHGDRPVVWLTPFHPRALEQLTAYRYEKYHRQTTRYLASAGRRLGFDFVDLSDLKTFGGDPRDFYDGVHMKPANTRRAVDYLARHQLLDREGTPPD